MNDLYLFTVPTFIKTLGGLKTVLEKAAAHAADAGMSDADLLAKRLAPDMFPLVQQVQSTCDHAKGGAARLSGTDAPVFADNEQSIAELLARIDKTIAFLHTVSEESFKDAASRRITLAYFPGKYLTGLDYAREYLIPNFFFHAVTAYGIVRAQGVAIGKADYANHPNFQDLETA